MMLSTNKVRGCMWCASSCVRANERVLVHVCAQCASSRGTLMNLKLLEAGLLLVWALSVCMRWTETWKNVTGLGRKYIYIYIYICMCVCIYIYIYMYVYIYIYIYIYIFGNMYMSLVDFVNDARADISWRRLLSSLRVYTRTVGGGQVSVRAWWREADDAEE
jgi:hypothetical protein